MKLISFDKELVDINKIKNIISIDYKDLIVTSAKDKIKIIPGFIVVYDNNKYMYLTSLDKNFDVFVNTIRNVYLEEQNNIVKEGIFGKEKIKISPFAKSLLLGSELERTNELYNYYNDKDSYEKSLLFEEDKVKSFFDIIKYHLVETLKMFDIVIDNIKISNGNNGNYYINALINKEPKILPVYFKKDKNNYSISIGNLFDNSMPLEINISFFDNKISVITSVKKYKYKEFNTYYSDNKEREINIDGNVVFYKKEKLESTDFNYDNLLSIDSSCQSLIWYKLPWNAYIGSNGSNLCIKEDGTLEDVDGKDRIITNSFIYLSVNEDYYFLKELYSKRYTKRTSVNEEMQSLKLDSIDKTTIGIKNDNIVTIETFFDDDGITGFYKKYLSRKHFYMLGVSSSFDKININNIINLGRKEKVFENVDLINAKKHIKGREF